MTAPIEPDDLVRFLADERARQGLSQREVTRRLGTSSSCLSNWERGVSSPTLSNLHRWARALGLRLRLRAEDES
jgi:transcriptional regulator with XRE-family HTH domain